MRTFITGLCLLVCLSFGIPAYGHKPANPYQELFDAYKAGKADEARKLLFAHVQSKLRSGSQPFKPKSASDAKIYLSNATGAVSLLAAALREEQKLVKTATPADEVLAAAGQARENLTSVKAQIAISQYKRNKDVLKGLEYGDKSEAALAAAQIRVNHELGRDETVQELIQQDLALLVEHEIMINRLMSNRPVSDPAPSAQQITPGVVLPIADLLNDFYKALAAEDEAALDRVLADGKGLRTGADLIARLNQEKERHRAFDRMLVPEFDDKTTLSIEADGAQRYKVFINGIIKRGQLKDQVVTQRQTDYFEVVRSTDGQYQIYEKGSGSDK